MRYIVMLVAKVGRILLGVDRLVEAGNEVHLTCRRRSRWRLPRGHFLEAVSMRTGSVSIWPFV